MNINSNYLNLYQSYLFTAVAERVAQFERTHPERDIIRLSIGDVTEPLCPAVVKAMERAAGEMGERETFHGYGPEASVYAYPELLSAIRRHYLRRGVSLKESEIFVSDGAKSDLGNLSDLFSADNTVLLPDPVYPAYRDVNLIAGRRLKYLRACAENEFLPMPDAGDEADIIYLCSPNNPTGAVYSKDKLQGWVEFSRKNGAVILFDAAYESFIREPSLPHSIFEIEGARECAIEICSFSKTAGFTGVRCGYTIVPQELKRGGASLNALFRRRQTTAFNGVGYITQMGAAAAFSEEGERQIRESIDVYRGNAEVISACLRSLGITFIGGENAPYLWLKCPDGSKSWDFFDELLLRTGVVGTPGCGFGESGESYFRLTAFGKSERTREACRRIKAEFGS